VGVSFNQPEYTMDVTGSGVTRLLEQIRLFSPKTRFVQAGSSEQFGDAPAPQNENTPFRPRSPYAVAKVAAYYAVKVYRETYNLHASTAISFNHESPRRGKDFVTRKVTDYIGRLVNGLIKEPLLLGNLDAKRDWSAATDILMGMWLIAQQQLPSDYVLASGETYTVREFVSAAFAAANMPIEWRSSGEREYAVFAGSEHIAVRVDPSLYRPCEVPLLLGDFTKAKTILGWYPTIPFQGLVEWMVQSDIDVYTNYDHTKYQTNNR
jgi:GDPmannose 4,6-dehydratase